MLRPGTVDEGPIRSRERRRVVADFAAEFPREVDELPGIFRVKPQIALQGRPARLALNCESVEYETRGMDVWQRGSPLFSIGHSSPQGGKRLVTIGSDGLFETA